MKKPINQPPQTIDLQPKSSNFSLYPITKGHSKPSLFTYFPHFNSHHWLKKPKTGPKPPIFTPINTSFALLNQPKSPIPLIWHSSIQFANPPQEL